MIKFSATLAFMSACLAFAPSLSNAGGVSDGGGDNITWEDSAAWFTGSSRTVKACVSISKEFGKSESEIRNSISEAYAKWKNYFEQKEIYTTFDKVLSAPTTNIEILSRCGKGIDLVFYFGVETPEVVAAKKKYLRPTALAIRTQYAKETTCWGKGFIWIANPKSIDMPNIGTGHFPNWDKPNNLKSILLHEIGHVLGSPHVEETVMTQDITGLLNWGDSWAETKFSIDEGRELVRCSSCHYHFSSLWDVGEKQRVVEILTSIFGEKPDDNVGVSSVLSLNFVWNQKVFPFTMTKGDRTLAAKIVITNETDLVLTGSVFQTVGYWYENKASVLYGFAIGVDNSKTPIILEYNMKQKVLVLSSFIDGSKTQLGAFDFEILK